MELINTISTKTKALKNKAKYAAAAVTLVMAYPMAFCDASEANTQLQKILNLAFGLMRWGGIFFLGYGVVLVGKTLASPDAGDPHGMTKGIGAIAGGILMIIVKPILDALGVTSANWISGT